MRSAILLTTVLMVTAAQAQTGTLKVQFVLDGKAPTASAIKVDKDPQFCGKHMLKDETLIVDPKTKGIANIVVFIRDKNVPVPAKLKGAAQKPVVIDNDKCRFSPRIVLAQTGQKLDLGNLDAVAHNIKIDPFENLNPAINPLLPAGARLTQAAYNAEERLPVKISCSIHPWMAGYMVIRNHPYMAISDKTGTIKLENLPPGNWEFQFWQEKCGYVDTFTNGKKWRRGRVKLKITAGKTQDLGTLKIPVVEFK